MAVLTTAQRKKLPKSAFALPSKNGYPINDRKHAANAKARATQMHKKGKLSRSAMQRIHAKANKVLKSGEK